MFAHAPGFDANHPSYAMLMQGSDQFVNSPYYPWQGMQSGIKGMPVHPSAYQGMSATLAPAALDNTALHNSTHLGANTALSTPVTHSTPLKSAPHDSAPSAGLDFSFGQGPTGSGQVTPSGGEGFWDNFVFPDNWEDSNDKTNPDSKPASVKEEARA
jgi:hypothetical protein